MKEKIIKNIKKLQSDQKKYHNKKIKKKSNLNIRDKVLLYNTKKAKQ